MIQREIEALLRPSIESMGCEWWGCEFVTQGRQGFLRIFIDKPDGVGIDDCQQVSRQVSALLDVHDVIPGQYRLEISSPGIPRPLFYPDQYLRYVGELIQIRLSRPMAGQRKITGRLVSVANDVLVLGVDGIEQEFLFSNVSRASLIDERGGA